DRAPLVDRYDRRQPELGRRLLERGGDAVPEAVGGAASLRAEERGDRPMVGHFGAAARALVEVTVDGVALVGLHGVEGVGPEEVSRLVVGQLSLHTPPIPTSTRSARMRLRPERMRLFTVPSGWSSAVATWR